MYVATLHDVEKWSEDTAPSPLVKRVDLDLLHGIETTRDAFLPNFVGLLEVDLVSVSSLRRVGKSFLFRCSCLTRVDLTPLGTIDAVGANFLHGCSGLTDVDLSPLRRLQAIPSGFLQGCSGLMSLDLQPLARVRSIGPHFLNGCSSLGPILDLTPFASNLATVGQYFMANCTSLTNVDLSPILSGERMLHPVGDHFLERCTSLLTVALPKSSGLNPPTVLGSQFLQGCLRLTKIDLSFFHQVEQIGNHFLHGCCALSAVDLTPFERSLRVVGGSFLYGCSGIATLDLTPLQKLVSIGNYFLVGTSPALIFTDDRSLVLDALRSSSLLDRCCIAGLAYVQQQREVMRRLLEQTARLQRDTVRLESEGSENRACRLKYDPLCRQHEVLTAVHGRVSAEAAELKERLERTTSRMEVAESRVAELIESKAKLQAKYTKFRDSDLNVLLHEAKVKLEMVAGTHDQVTKELKEKSETLQSVIAEQEKCLGNYGSLSQMSQALSEAKEDLVKTKARLDEAKRKLAETQTRLNSEVESKNQLQARFMKLQQELKAKQ